MRVLILHPPQYVGPDYIDYPTMTPLGAWTAAAHLTNDGHDVRLVDAFTLPGSEVIKNRVGGLKLGAPIENVINAANSRPFDLAVLQLSPFSVQEQKPEALYSITKALKLAQPDSAIVWADLFVGGMNAILYEPERFLSKPSSPFAIVRFEAEHALSELAKKKPQAIREETRVIEGKPWAGLISAYGGHLYDMADIANYRHFLKNFYSVDTRPNHFAINEKTIPFKSSRGCGYDCIFCTGLVLYQPSRNF